MNARIATLNRRAVSAVAIGNLLEWYDFVVYGYFAATFATNFFPAKDETTSLLAAFAAFGVGFIFRPIGAAAIGVISDTKGRRAALILSVTLMAFGTLLTGLLPSYDTIGVAAPILLVLARLIQGFSIGGEWGSSIVYVVEIAPEEKRGLYGSFQQMTLVAGLLFGSGISALLSTVLATAPLQSWGWRVPYLIGALIAPIGFYMRRSLDETPLFLKKTEGKVASEGIPFVKTAQAFGVCIVWAVSAYIFLVYMPTFTQEHAELNRATALWSNTVALLLLMIAIPICGLVSDHVGRKPLLLAGCFIFITLPFPLFYLILTKPSFGLIMMTQLIFAVAVALFSGAAPAALSELFETSRRTTSLSIANGMAIAIFGGFAPFIATWLIVKTGSPIAPVYYVIASAAVSSLVILGLRETVHDKLEQGVS